MSRVAIIAAMAGELKPLVKGWQHERTAGADGIFVDLWRRRLVDEAGNEDEWVAACAGAGADAARRAFTAVERLGAVDRAISLGWAGALRDELEPGKAYWAAGAIDAQTGERFAAEEPPELWVVTSARVADGTEKKRLAETYGAGLVDMEAAAVARLAAMRGIPFRCVKGVSDGFRDDLPDFNRFLSVGGKFLMARFVLFAIFRPLCWPALIRMGENSTKAAQAMREAMLTHFRFRC